MNALYNEIDPYAARWLRNLSTASLIAEGSVDEQSIEDLTPEDVSGVRQFHAFAGIGVWSYALRLAGVGDDAPVWTGSCPCQPFSVAGKRGGTADRRHLWPAWFALIRECRPPIVFGEQVASPAGRDWLDAVSADLEGVGYRVGSADLGAACVGAPHIRQRLWFVAYRGGEGLEGWQEQSAREKRPAVERSGDADLLGHSGGEGGGRNPGTVPRPEGESEGERIAARGVADELELAGAASGVAHTDRERPPRIDSLLHRPDQERRNETHGTEAPGSGEDHSGVGSTNPWEEADWLPCSDGKYRPVEPGTFPLVDGAAFKLGSGSPLEGKSRIGMLRAYGNAIVPQVAAAFVKAAREAKAA